MPQTQGSPPGAGLPAGAALRDLVERARTIHAASWGHRNGEVAQQAIHRTALDELITLLESALGVAPDVDALEEISNRCGVPILHDSSQVAKVLVRGDEQDRHEGADLALSNARPATGRAEHSAWVVQLQDGRCAALLHDPWNDDQVRRAAAGQKRYLEPMAVRGQTLAELVARCGDAAEVAAEVAAMGASDTAGTKTVPRHHVASPTGTHAAEDIEPVPSPGAAASGWRSSHPPTPRSPGAEDSEVVRFVDHAIHAAYREGASDVHFECDRAGVTVKLRLDGVMSTLSRLSGQRHSEEVISRIKVLAQLDITERRLPQDGRLRYEVPARRNDQSPGSDSPRGPNEAVRAELARSVLDDAAGSGLDLRVSIMPSVHGEDAVLRLLDKSHLRDRSRAVTLEALGFAPLQARRIRLQANLPNGMLLVTGPTGSGKTTTVYAALSEIHTGQEKIITIEDPVEYELPGVLQIPVNERKGLTFARGLRSILRHDPDRILVGEIRDAETAEIAVQAALTGHLVFTTVHANSLFDVIGRFRHFGIDMFGFVSSLNGVVVQRLIRRLCEACSAEREPTDEEAQWLAAHGAAEVSRLARPVGCEQCHHSGYRGRFVIAETHQVSDAFRSLVLGGADVAQLKRSAFSGEHRPLLEMAIDEVRAQRTSLEELFRVVGQL